MEIKVTLTFRDKTFELSRDEAKKLRDVLDGMVGEKIVEGHCPWVLPYEWQSHRPWWETQPHITWCSDNASISVTAVAVT